MGEGLFRECSAYSAARAKDDQFHGRPVPHQLPFFRGFTCENILFYVDLGSKKLMSALAPEQILGMSSFGFCGRHPPRKTACGSLMCRLYARAWTPRRANGALRAIHPDRRAR